MLKNFVFFVFLAVAGSFAYPQDAEFIPSTVPKRDSGNIDPAGDDGIVIVSVQPSNVNPFTSFFDQVFRTGVFPSRSRPSLFPDDTPVFVPNIFPTFSFDFPRVDDLIPSLVPDIGDLPDNYNNSTHDVRVVNGTRIETNMTVTKSKDDNGVFVQEVHIIRYSPENKEGTPDPSRGDASPTPEVNTFNNEIPSENSTAKDYEDFGSISSSPHIRKRRWTMPKFLQRLFGLPKTTTEKPLPTRPPTTFRSYAGDTRVNYINNNHINNIESDAEVFDPKALMNDRQNSLAESINSHRFSHKPVTLGSSSGVERHPVVMIEDESNVNRLSSSFRTLPSRYSYQRYYHSNNNHRAARYRSNL